MTGPMAHQRHWRDAQHLEQHGRRDNADHLYGFAAECGLKALMLAFGMQLELGAPKDQADRVHADRIWTRYEAYRSGYAAATQFQLSGKNPFASWQASDRYARTGAVGVKRLRAHRAGADQVVRLVNLGRQKGLLR
ncbi:MAG: SAM-dependent methyltransferase [Gemmatimonadaceae bacterium]|nr:SAM-dependent methyltransferase [Gemmatimonadaceae bacterium]